MIENIDHSARAHALLSPSSAHRWVLCTPSARLEEQFPDGGSPYAAEGTLAHELAEIKLKRLLTKMTASQKAGLTKHERLIRDDPNYSMETEDATDRYARIVELFTTCFIDPPVVAIEQKLDLSEWTVDGFGTADCILIGDNELHVIDYKHGKGVPVAAEGNLQMALYALGALRLFESIYDIKTVRMSIIQPRIRADADTWETTPEALQRLGKTIATAAKAAYNGQGVYNPGEKQCRFCKARATCRARADHNVKLAFAAQSPTIAPEEIAEYLRKGADVAKWLEDLKAHALKLCLAGETVEGLKAVEGRGSREWTDAQAAYKAVEASGVEHAMLYEEVPLTLAKVEKLMGKKNFEAVVGKYVKKMPGKPALVEADDPRPGITLKPSAEEAFAD